MVALLALLLSASPEGWVASELVESLEHREKVAALLAELAVAQLAAGKGLEAQVAAETCLSIDRYRCSCIRDAGLAGLAMKSVDEATAAAVREHAWNYLMEYLQCDETAPDGARIAKQAEQLSPGRRWPRSIPPLGPGGLDALSSDQLLAEGNLRFDALAPLEAKRRFEACALREPVRCDCVRRLGDVWLKLEDRQRAMVWWSRYLDCAPDAKDRDLVRRDVEAAKNALRDVPAWDLVSSGPRTPIPVAPKVAASLLARARRAAAEKRLTDAVPAFTACRLIDLRQLDCTLELAKVLDTLGRGGEALRLYHQVAEQLPKGDPRRAQLPRRAPR